MSSDNLHPIAPQSRVLSAVEIAEFFKLVTAMFARVALIVPLGIVGMIIFTRSAVNYEAYLEASVGPAALKRASDATWIQDAQLWTDARKSFWLDTFAVATEPGVILAISCMAVIVSGAIFLADIEIESGRRKGTGDLPAKDI